MKTKRQSATLFAESKRCVSGGSEVSERTLRATVRALLRSGLLRPIDGKALAGQGRWKHCVVCGEQITPGQLQVEPDGSQAAESVVHVPCFLAWYAESNAVDEEGLPEAPHGKHSSA